MQRLEVSDAVRSLLSSLGVKGLQDWWGRRRSSKWPRFRILFIHLRHFFQHFWSLQCWLISTCYHSCFISDTQILLSLKISFCLEVFVTSPQHVLASCCHPVTYWNGGYTLHFLFDKITTLSRPADKRHKNVTLSLSWIKHHDVKANGDWKYSSKHS